MIKQETQQKLKGAQEKKNNNRMWSSRCGTVEMNPTSIHGDVGLTHDLAQWVKDPSLL